MSQKELQQIEICLILLARAIEEGRIDNLTNDVKTILGYELNTKE